MAQAMFFTQVARQEWTAMEAPPAPITQTPALCGVGPKLHVAVQATQNTVNLLWCDVEHHGHDWAGPFKVPQGESATNTSPAMAEFNGMLYLVYQGRSDDALHCAVWNPATNAWLAGDQVIRTNQNKTLDGIHGSPALTVFNGSLYVLYQLYGATGNLRCGVYDGTSWSQVNPGQNISNVPGMSGSPSATTFGDELYVFYQGYGSNGSLTGATFDGTQWQELHPQAKVMAASPAATSSGAGLQVCYQGYGNSGDLVVVASADASTWTTVRTMRLHMSAETGPAATAWADGAASHAVVAVVAPAEAIVPTYPPLTTLSVADQQSLVQAVTPVIQLAAGEQYFPAEVGWFVDRVTLTCDGAPVTPPVTLQNMNDHYVNGQVSYAIPNGVGRYDPARSFRLSINGASTLAGIQPSGNQPPVYAAVLDNVSLHATDVLFMFLYAFNGEAGNAIFGIGTHEGDWEHVIVRVARGTQDVLGMYCQAHSSTDAFSGWYAPPGGVFHGSIGNFTFYGDTVQPIVYSARESHASYTTGGSHPIGPLKGDDQCGGGLVWQPAAVLVSLAGTPWLQYGGKWGAKSGLFGNPPDAPVSQGWFAPMATGPSGPAARLRVPAG